MINLRTVHMCAECNQRGQACVRVSATLVYYG